MGNADQSTVTITPSPSDGTYRDGETVTVAVGANGLFPGYSKVNILECADPGGATANLPTSFSDCDGDTIQGGTIITAADGSFSEPDYQIYSLPNRALGEQPNRLPLCNVTNPCVLYVGEDQNNFSQPKMFSAPFTVASTPVQLSLIHISPTKNRSQDRV